MVPKFLLHLLLGLFLRALHIRTHWTRGSRDIRFRQAAVHGFGRRLGRTLLKVPRGITNSGGLTVFRLGFIALLIHRDGHLGVYRIVFGPDAPPHAGTFATSGRRRRLGVTNGTTVRRLFRVVMSFHGIRDLLSLDARASTTTAAATPQ